MVHARAPLILIQLLHQFLTFPPRTWYRSPIRRKLTIRFLQNIIISEMQIFTTSITNLFVGLCILCTMFFRWWGLFWPLLLVKSFCFLCIMVCWVLLDCCFPNWFFAHHPMLAVRSVTWLVLCCGTNCMQQWTSGTGTGIPDLWCAVCTEEVKCSPQP